MAADPPTVTQLLYGCSHSAIALSAWGTEPLAISPWLAPGICVSETVISIRLQELATSSDSLHPPPRCARLVTRFCLARRRLVWQPDAMYTVAGSRRTGLRRVIEGTERPLPRGRSTCLPSTGRHTRPRPDPHAAPQNPARSRRHSPCAPADGSRRTPSQSASCTLPVRHRTP